MYKNIAVIGAGSWGTALAQLLNDNGYIVNLWVRNIVKAEKIRLTRYNADYLPNIMLANTINITADLGEVVKAADVLVLVVPSVAMREICCQISSVDKLQDKTIISCTKGFEKATCLRMSEVIDDVLPGNQIAVLSGPNHAEEVALRQPAATVLASTNAPTAEQLQAVFQNSYFRPYISTDVIGVEIAGALKNIIAVTSGILHGLNFGDNCQASLVTRGLAEIQRLGIALGAKPETFVGLSGIGDLIATCTSKHSRNRCAGEALANGKTMQQICQNSQMVVEGFNAITIAYSLAKKYKIEMPITESLFSILVENKDVNLALKELMMRKGKYEF